jgi:hypothetical protein
MSMMRAEWRMAAVAAAFVVVGAALGVGCGGKGAEHFSDGTSSDPDPSASPGPEGQVVLMEFVAPEESAEGPPASDGSTVFRSSIGPVGTSNPQGSLIRFRLLNADGRPAKNGVRVLFTIEGPTDATLTLTKDRSENGFVETVLHAGPTPGNAVVVAQVQNTTLIARSPVIAIGRPPGDAVALEFFGLRVPGLIGNADDNAGTPETRTQLGVRGSGFNQAVDVVFAVLDDRGGAAADGTIVDFSLFGPNGGESLSPASATSANGFVSSTITTGTRPGPVEVTAQVRGTSVQAHAIPITIASALNPAAAHMSIAAQCLNMAGSVTFGLQDRIRAGLSDQFGNSIPLDSAVSFFSEGGGMNPQGISPDGLEASADLISQLPIPSDRRVQVMAVTTGQESFTDVNGNGQFDPGEPFVDTPQEVYLDANEDGVYEVGEFFIDSNNNGVFDGAPNGIWDAQALISAQMPIIFSGSSTISATPDSFALGFNEHTTITFFIRDDIGHPLTGITKVRVEGKNVDVIPTDFGIPDTNRNTLAGPVPNLTAFDVVVINASNPPAAGGSVVEKVAAVTLTVTSPIEGTGNVEGTECPGGNGNVFTVVFGTVLQPG